MILNFIIDWMELSWVESSQTLIQITLLTALWGIIKFLKLKLKFLSWKFLPNNFLIFGSFFWQIHATYQSLPSLDQRASKSTISDLTIQDIRQPSHSTTGNWIFRCTNSWNHCAWCEHDNLKTEKRHSVLQLLQKVGFLKSIFQILKNLL